MSLLFGSTPTHLVSVEFYNSTEVPGETVWVGNKLWTRLLEDAGSLIPANIRQLTISLTSTRRLSRHQNSIKSTNSKVSPSALETITCWAVPHSQTPDSSINVPHKWLRDYPRVFPVVNEFNVPNFPPTHHVCITQPALLNEIFVIAMSASAYELARSSSNVLENWLTQDNQTEEATAEQHDDDGSSTSRIVRQGDLLTYTPPRHGLDGEVGRMNGYTNGGTNPAVSLPARPFEFHYQVIMTGPVLQGCCQMGYTKFFVAPGNYEDSPDVPMPSNHVLPSNDLEEASGNSSDAESVEIDERFLASSFLSPPTSLTTSSVLPNNDTNYSEGVIKVDDSNGASVATGTSNFFSVVPDTLKLTYFALNALEEQPLSVAAPSDITLDEDPCIYLRTADLGRAGIFSGDWAIIIPQGSKNARLARVKSDDQLPDNCPNPTTYASPVFCFNLRVNNTTSKLSPATSTSNVIIRPSPFGTRSPSVPTARAVTIARVASPHASDRTYQPLFLRALKSHFKDKKRLLKKGDIFAVPIHLEQARLLGERAAEKDGDLESAIKNENVSDDILEYEFPLSSSSPSSVVFFQVTNLEYDVLETGGDVTPADHYVAATMGELGCWIDPAITKMMQTGVEHSGVPDVSAYYGLDTGYAPMPVNSRLTARDTPYQKLKDLVEASLLPTSVDYDLHISILLKGSRGIGKQTVARWVARQLGIHVFEINCFNVVGETDVKTEGTLRARFEQAAGCSPCICLLRHIDALARTSQTLESGKEPVIIPVLQECLADLRQAWRLSGFPVIVVGTTSDPEKVPVGVLGCFKHEIAFEVPNEPERQDILFNLLSNTAISPDVSLPSVATQTAALVAADLVDLVSRTRLGAIERSLTTSTSISGKKATENDVMQAGIQLTGADFDVALSKARASYSESIGAPKIPNVSWDDVGGLANVKADILDTIQLPLEHPELFADGLKKRSGILLYGPPGTGKTLLAKAVATSCSLNFFSVKGPELLNMYIGESEANVRRVFQRARDAKPCVIFFDELDSVAPKRGNHGDSGGVMDRIVSQLLAELDGMADSGSGADVFVIGATNRPDLLDSALLRPGRFDRMLYLGVSDTHDAQLKIMQALTRKFRLDPSLNLSVIANQCPFNYTGADFYALCSDAMLKAMSRKAEDIEATIAELNLRPPPYEHPHPLTPQYYLAEMATESETDVLVSQKDFELALKELVPSVSASEMDHYRQVQQRFAKDTINSTKELDPEVEEANRRRSVKGKGKARD